MAFLLTAACGSYPGLREIAPKINATLSTDAFVVVGDVVKVSFPQRPEWNHGSSVRGDGKATFPFLGDLEVVGLSVKGLNDKLTAAYSSMESVGVGQVVADLDQVAPREVIVIGEVKTPGAIEFGRGHLTLIEAIGRAGGPAKGSALLEETLLVRWDSKAQKQVTWRIDAGLEQWQSDEPLYLQPHDVVFVPNNTIDKVNVWVDKYIRQNLPLPFAFAFR